MSDKNLNAYLKYKPDVSNCPPDLFFASKRNDLVLKKLIKNGLRPYVQAKKGIGKYVIFQLMEKDMKDETIVLLLDNIKKENIQLINEPDSDKYILHKAVESGHLKTVAKLLDLGADPDITNNKGVNASKLAANQPEILKLLNER